MRTSFPRCARSGRSAMQKSSKSSMRERLRAATVGKMPAMKWSEAGSFSKISKTWSGGGSGVGPGGGSARGLESGATVRMRVRGRARVRSRARAWPPPISPYVSLCLPMSPYVSLCLPISHGPRARAWQPPRRARARRARRARPRPVGEIWGDMGRCGEIWGDICRARRARPRPVAAGGGVITREGLSQREEG